MPSDIGIVLAKVKETIPAKMEVGAGGRCGNLNKVQTTCPLNIVRDLQHGLKLAHTLHWYTPGVRNQINLWSGTASRI